PLTVVIPPTVAHPVPLPAPPGYLAGQCCDRTPARCSRTGSRTGRAWLANLRRATWHHAQDGPEVAPPPRPETRARELSDFASLTLAQQHRPPSWLQSPMPTAATVKHCHRRRQLGGIHR